jgi:HTH-type transcriptional regulator/antitoxin HigA
MTETIRPIRSEQDYEEALARIDSLMDARPGTPEADELDLLATLVEWYEKQHFPIEKPDPVAAIRFRLEQANQTSRDLVPLLGSRAKVSEVMSGKRGLTLQMIRALHRHLGIPAEVLLQETAAASPSTGTAADWTRFPIAAMVKAGWFDAIRRTGPGWKAQAEVLMRDLIERAGGLDAVPEALYRKGVTSRQNAKTDRFALKAWCYQVIATAQARSLPAKYRPGVVTELWARKLAKLSASFEGPQLAKEYLERHGIHLIHTVHLPRTYLDGAAMLLPNGTPVIAVTLRFDRLDNFWFCLFHELAHIALHLRDKNDLFIDDLSLDGSSDGSTNRAEAEADRWAADMLIPPDAWQRSAAAERPTLMNVVSLAQELGIHPAIVAGRVRKERRNFHLLSQMVGNRQVRQHLASGSSRN